MSENQPFIVERSLITERMTDYEINSFDASIELYLNGSVFESDWIIAHEINMNMWRPIWHYRRILEDYYAKEDARDAEQDY